MPRSDWLDARRVVVGVALLVGLAAVLMTVRDGIAQPRAALCFAALVCMGELMRVNLPGDRDASPVGGAAAFGYSLVTSLGDRGPADHDAWTVVAVMLVATTVAAALHVFAQRDPRPSDVARRLLVVAVVAGSFRVLLETRVGDFTTGRNQPLVAMAVALGLGIATDLLLGAAITAARQGAPFAPTVGNEVRAGLALSSATAATGLLIAVAIPRMDLYALVVFSVPLLATQYSFRRFASISSTYRQTIRALSRMSEVAGYVEDGHSRRVTTLAVAVGREFGLTDAEMLDLEYAALMHDIGQLSLAEPIPRGSTLAVAPAERRRIAELGADVIRSTGVLDGVATIVAEQASPYRRMREAGDGDVPLASRIIKVCSAYDDLVRASHRDRGARAAWDAMERIRMGMAYEYDPVVVEGLTRVLRRGGELTDALAS